MSKTTRAEKIVFDILSGNEALMAKITELHLRVRDIDSYADRLPAVGVKAMQVKFDNENGEEYADGFCEVVCMGEYEVASILSEQIGNMIYEILQTSTDKIPGHDYEGVESSGYAPVETDKDGMYICLTHVFWTLWF